jgi:hypothetical protein
MDACMYVCVGIMKSMYAWQMYACMHVCAHVCGGMMNMYAWQMYVRMHVCDGMNMYVMR